MKKMLKQIGAVALVVCMMLSMVQYASAATYNVLTVKVKDTDLNKTITMDSGSRQLGDTAKLIEEIFTVIGGAAMGDGIDNTYKTNHINHRGGITSPLCTVASCHLYSIWTTELDDWFDNAKAAYVGNTWATWVGSVNDNLFGQGDSELKDLLKDTASEIRALTVDKEYTMPSNDGRYELSVKRTQKTTGGGGGGGGSMTTTETVTNPDGSVTTIITDKAAGTVTEITVGTNEVTTTTVTDKNGKQSVTEVVVPTDAAEPVKLPDPVKTKDELNIDLPEGGAEIVIPVEVDKPGNVVVIVHPDGTEEVIKGTTLTNGGVVVTLDGDARVKVVDKSKTFVDMTGHWANNAVDYVAARGLFAGTGDGTTFSPEMKLTRAMMAQVIYNLEGAEKHNYSHGFPDVASGMWYTDAVNWAAREGVVAGYGDGLYRPDKLLSREEVVQIFFNYAKAKGYDISKRTDLSGFVDHMTISDWARVAKKWGVASGLIAGKGGNVIDPLANTTRAECAQMFMNFLEKVVKN